MRSSMMPPSVVADQRVLGLANGHRRDLADQGVVQERGGVRAGDPDFAHVGEVEQARGLADGVVLGEFGAVLQRHLPAAEVREGGAELLVLFVKCRVILSHRWLSLVVGVGVGGVVGVDCCVFFEGFEGRAGADQVAVPGCAVDPSDRREVLVLLERVDREDGLLARVRAGPVGADRRRRRCAGALRSGLCSTVKSPLATWSISARMAIMAVDEAVDLAPGPRIRWAPP